MKHPHPRPRFSLKTGIAKIRSSPRGKRIIYFLKWAGIILIILWQGHEHPISQNIFINQSYHLIAFAAVFVSWGLLGFIGAGFILKYFERIPPWLIFCYLFVTLLAIVLGRMQIDQYLREKSGIGQIMIEDSVSDNFH